MLSQCECELHGGSESKEREDCEWAGNGRRSIYIGTNPENKRLV
jgi:hypothetical protein